MNKYINKVSKVKVVAIVLTQIIFFDQEVKTEFSNLKTLTIWADLISILNALSKFH